jgi:beta-glucosidase-like glycosyl hydrolase
MRLNKYIFFLFFIIFSYSFGQNPLTTKDHVNQKKWVDSIYNSLSSDEKIGQLFTIWVATKQGTEQMDKVAEKIKKNHLGGLIFSLGNIKDQAKYTNKFQSISKVPLLIGMDAEWGIGMRLDDAFSFPFNMTLGAIEDDALIYKVGKRIGAHAKRLGVHMNYAPVTDINTNPNNPIIGSRSFGEDKFNVTNKALHYLRGMQSEGIMGSAKHFPGHGDTELDSHLTLPKINFSSKRIDEVELFPYRELIKNNLSSVMVAHMEIPSLEKEPKKPSTLSKNIITKLLKKKMKFKGLVITDAMDMKGVVDFNKNRSADVDAILAGNDVLLMPNDLDESTKNIKSALKSGVISEKRLEYSVKKILMAKYKAGLYSLNPVELENIVSEMNDEKDHALFEEITEKSITVIKNKKDLLPIKNLESKTAYISLGDSDHSEFYKSLNYYSKVDKIEYNSNQELLSKLKLYDQVIVGFHKSNKDPFQSYKFSKKELEILNLISKESNVILNVFAKPYALMDLKIDNISSILISYQNNTTAQSKSAQIIFGSIGSKGKLPVTISKSFPVNTSIKTKKLNRLSYGLPSSKIFNIQNLKKIDSIVDYAINQKMTPGAQVLISKDGKVFFNKSYGFKTYENKESVKWNDLYDVASLTKILSSVPLLMNEFENGSITDEIRLSDIINDINLKDKSNLLLKEMLSHQSGLFPWIPFYKETIDSISKYPLDTFYSKKKTIISLLM